MNLDHLLRQQGRLPPSVIRHGSSIAVISLHTDQIRKYAELTAENKRQYCVQNGYDYICYTNSLDDGRPPSWSKIVAILKHLSSYKWVLWADADLVIMDYKVRLESIIDAKFDMVLPCFDFNRRTQTINAGCFLVRNNEWASKFLRDAYGYTHLITHCLWEQQAFSEMIDNRYPGSDRRIKWVHYHTMNQPFKAFKGPEFIVHFCAVEHIRGDIDWRYRLAMEYLAKVRR